MPLDFLTPKQQVPTNVEELKDSLIAIRGGVTRGNMTYDEVKPFVSSILKSARLEHADALKIMKDLYSTKISNLRDISSDKLKLKGDKKLKFESALIPPVDLFILTAIAEHFSFSFYIALPPVDMALIAEQRRQNIERQRSFVLNQLAQGQINQTQQQEIRQLDLLARDEQARFERARKAQELAGRENELRARLAQQSIEAVHQQEMSRLHERQAQLEQAEANFEFNRMYLAQVQSSGLQDYRIKYPSIAQQLLSQVASLGEELTRVRVDLDKMLKQWAEYIQQNFDALNRRLAQVEARVDVVDRRVARVEDSVGILATEMAQLRLHQATTDTRILNQQECVAVNQELIKLKFAIIEHERALDGIYGRIQEVLSATNTMQWVVPVYSSKDNKDYSELNQARRKFFEEIKSLLTNYEKILQGTTITRDDIKLATTALYNTCVQSYRVLGNKVTAVGMTKEFLNLLVFSFFLAYPDYDLSTGIAPVVKSVADTSVKLDEIVSGIKAVQPAQIALGKKSQIERLLENFISKLDEHIRKVNWIYGQVATPRDIEEGDRWIYITREKTRFYDEQVGRAKSVLIGVFKRSTGLTEQQALLAVKSFYNVLSGLLNNFVRTYVAQKFPANLSSQIDSGFSKAYPNYNFSIKDCAPIIDDTRQFMEHIESLINSPAPSCGAGGSQSFMPAPRQQQTQQPQRAQTPQPKKKGPR